MKTLREKAARRRLAAWRPPSSHLGLTYLLALVLTHGVAFWLIFLYFKYDQDCQPVWPFWLTGLRHHTSIFETSVACFVGFTAFIVISFVGYLRSASCKRKPGTIIYLTILAYPVSALFALYLLWGAMIPMSGARPVFVQAMEIVEIWQPAWTWDIVEHTGKPFGSCPTYENLERVRGSQRPDVIGPL